MKYLKTATNKIPPKSQFIFFAEKSPHRPLHPNMSPLRYDKLRISANVRRNAFTKKAHRLTRDMRFRKTVKNFSVGIWGLFILEVVRG